MLHALDVNVRQDTEPHLKNLMAQFPHGITFQVLRDMIRDHAFYRIQRGRFFVTLSLREAESLRAVIHHRRAHPLHESAFTSASTGVALRTSYTVLDETPAFRRAEEYQEKIAVSCQRYIDCNVAFSDVELGMLLRALQYNSMDDRARFFEEVRFHLLAIAIAIATVILSYLHRYGG